MYFSFFLVDFFYYSGGFFFTVGTRDRDRVLGQVSVRCYLVAFLHTISLFSCTILSLIWVRVGIGAVRYLVFFCFVSMSMF